MKKLNKLHLKKISKILNNKLFKILKLKLKNKLNLVNVRIELKKPITLLMLELLINWTMRLN